MLPDRRYEAIIFVRSAAESCERAGGSDAHLAEMAAHAAEASIELVVVTVPTPAADECLHDVMSRLWAHGIDPQQVLRVADDIVKLSTILDDQIARRRSCELPAAGGAETWTVVIEDPPPELERAKETLLTLADGAMGTRGTGLMLRPESDPAVLMTGVYTGSGSASHLLPAPLWNNVLEPGRAVGGSRRVLELHTGLLHQELHTDEGPVSTLQFASPSTPGMPVLRARGPLSKLRLAAPLQAAPDTVVADGRQVGEVSWMRVAGQPGQIVAAVHECVGDFSDSQVLDRIGSYCAAAHGRADERGALARLHQARRRGFEALLAEHRTTWASRWDDADLVIGGDPQLQLAVRFSLFHLMGHVADVDEAAVGARGMSGSAYHGHVFWDSDVFVLPFLAATRPTAARAMLEYRFRRLPAAQRAAREEGRDGARFAWESAASGADVTPTESRDSRGESVPILTGRLEEHIVADVAWAACCYVDWTGDEEFAAGEGLELLVQTARWWESRIQCDSDGSGHIRGVIGPDEYHVDVDDNAFTNGMAAWNLRRAAAVRATAVSAAERRRWLALADALVTGYSTHTRIYEQFAGFDRLEPLLIRDFAAHRPVAADVLLGPARAAAAQVIKQADVLMLHYLLPDAVAAGSLAPNLAHYEPRTAHGSTLSPGVHAALLARAGRLEEAVEMLHLAARIDLDDIGDSTAGGLHLAAMGSVWRALTFGFGGLRPIGDHLSIDPVLPDCWTRLELTVRFRGVRVRVEVHPDRVLASADRSLRAIDPLGQRVTLTATPLRLPMKSATRTP